MAPTDRSADSDTPDPGAAPRRRASPLPPEERREQLVRATRRLIGARGREVTTKEIAAAAEVGEGTIFTQFDSKESLLDEACDAELYDNRWLQGLAAIDPSLPLDERLLVWARICRGEIERVGAFIEVAHVVPDPRRLAPWGAEQKRIWQRLFGRDEEWMSIDGEELRVLLDASVSGAAWTTRRTGNDIDTERIVGALLHGVLLATPTTDENSLDTVPTDRQGRTP